MQPCARCIRDASGVEIQGRPGRSGRPNPAGIQRWGNRRRRSRRRGAATAIEWRTVRREPRAVVRSTLPEAEAVVSALVRACTGGAERSAGVLRRSARTSAASTAPGGARAGARRSRHPATHGAHRTEPEAMPAAGAAGQGERGEVCDKRGAKRRREENAAVVTPMPSNAAPAAADRHAAVSVSEPPGKRSAQRPKGAEARGIPARRGETAQRARQGSPVAKRRAQTHRMAHRTGIHLRHRHQHHRQHRRRQRSHRDRHRQRHHRRHQHRPRDRYALHIVVERREPVKEPALSLVKRRVRQAMRRKSGGAAAERGAAGDARSEGEPCGGGGGVRPKKRAAPPKRRGP